MYFLNKREYLYYKSQDEIACRVTIHENVNSAFAAEADACLEAVRLGLEMKEHRTYVEGDLISVIRKCISKSRDKSQICSIIHDLKNIQKEFKSIKFQHVHRTANTLADIIGTESLKQRGRRILPGRSGTKVCSQNTRGRKGQRTRLRFL
ncbi:hypothetical protein Gotur_022907 [Gossypium turneri]